MFARTRLAQDIASIVCKNGRLAFDDSCGTVVVIQLNDVRSVRTYKLDNISCRITFNMNSIAWNERYYNVDTKTADALLNIVREGEIPKQN